MILWHLLQFLTYCFLHHTHKHFLFHFFLKLFSCQSHVTIILCHFRVHLFYTYYSSFIIPVFTFLHRILKLFLRPTSFFCNILFWNSSSDFLIWYFFYVILFWNSSFVFLIYSTFCVILFWNPFMYFSFIWHFLLKLFLGHSPLILLLCHSVLKPFLCPSLLILF